MTATERVCQVQLDIGIAFLLGLLPVVLSFLLFLWMDQKFKIQTLEMENRRLEQKLEENQ